VPISTSIEVGRPATEVFDYVTDPSPFHEWQNGVTEGHLQSASPPTVGDRCLTTNGRIGFAQRPVTSEVTHVDPPHRWGVHGIDGPIRADVDVTVEPLDDDKRSKVTITMDFTGYGIGKLLVPLIVRPQARREMPVNVHRLKNDWKSSTHEPASNPPPETLPSSCADPKRAPSNPDGHRAPTAGSEALMSMPAWARGSPLSRVRL